MEMTSSLPSPQAATEMAKFIKQAGGNATWDRLAEHLEQTHAGRQSFVVNRTFDAPIERVFEMWARPEHLARWLPPAGTTLRFLRPAIAPGKSTLFVTASEHGTVHVRAEYLAIEPPRRIVYTQQFVDEREHLAPAPDAAVWPATLRTTVLFAEEAPDRTRVTVTSEPHGDTTPPEVAAFVHERSGMTLGWTGSFDSLETLLDPVGAV